MDRAAACMTAEYSSSFKLNGVGMGEQLRTGTRHDDAMRSATSRGDEKRPGSLPALTLLGLAAVPSPARHFELEPRLLGLDGSGAVLDPRAAFLPRLHWSMLPFQLLTSGSELRLHPRHSALERRPALMAVAGQPMMAGRAPHAPRLALVEA
jgi:hypothetical protein